MHASGVAIRPTSVVCGAHGLRYCSHLSSASPRVPWIKARGQQAVGQASSTDSDVKVERQSPSPMEETEDAERGEALELDPNSEVARKQQEADRLRSAEKFMVKGTGKALCISCGYEYEKQRGDPEYPITPGTEFEELPRDWQCPVCGAAKNTFQSQAVKVAGFAENQQYGFGGNSLTSGQKSLLIYGSLLLFFGLFLAGYLLQ